MMCCKGFDEAQTSKGRKELPTRSTDRLGKNARRKHTGAYIPVCSINCFRVSRVFVVNSQPFYWHTCNTCVERLSGCSHIVLQSHCLLSAVLHLKQNISISFENRRVHCSELSQYTVQRNHEGTTSELYCCSKTIAGVTIAFPELTPKHMKTDSQSVYYGSTTEHISCLRPPTTS